MKILYHHRTLGDGAEGIHIEEMVKAFRDLGHEVKVVAPIGEKTNTKNANVSILSKIKRMLPRILFEFIEVAYNVYGYYLLRKEIHKEHPDFIYDRYITFNASSVLIGKRFNVPVFLEVNAPLALERSEQKDEKLYMRRMAFAFEKWVSSNSYKTIVVSTPLKEYLVSVGVPQEKIIVMPNGVDVKKIKPKREKDKNLLKKCGFTEDDIIVGFVGILRPWHGLDLLLEAFNLAAKDKKNTRLLIVGDGPIRSDVELQVEKLHLTDKVFFTGRISHTNVADYVNLFDIAVSPKATFYASPMKILEYMALAKAVVAPDKENIRDIIVHGVDGLLFEDGSSVALFSCFEKLIQDNAYRAQLGRRARIKVIEERNWQRNAALVCAMER